jgi:hypothetical protein
MILSPEQARELWVKALRSGDYEQTTGDLRNGTGFCCLGVACDLYANTEGEGAWGPSVLGLSEFVMPGSKVYTSALPPEVAKWLGLSLRGPLTGILGVPSSRGLLSSGHSLANMNDAGFSFTSIAQEIEDGKLLLAP